MAKPKLKNVYVYPNLSGTLDKAIPDIWTCAHADIAPKAPGQVVLCEPCGDRLERGAKMIKRRSAATERLAQDLRTVAKRFVEAALKPVKKTD
jgi:hypothetical protein